MDWLPEELNWSDIRGVPTGLSEEHRNALPKIPGDPPFTPPPRRVSTQTSSDA